MLIFPNFSFLHILDHLSICWTLLQMAREVRHHSQVSGLTCQRPGRQSVSGGLSVALGSASQSFPVLSLGSEPPGSIVSCLSSFPFALPLLLCPPVCNCGLCYRD